MRNVKKVICEICNREISKSNISKHMRRHENNPQSFEIPKYRVQHEGLDCIFCGKTCKNNNSLRNHERLCKNNPNRQLTSYEKGIDTFYTTRIEGRVGKDEGSLVESIIYNRKCPHCNKWFKTTQIGNHVNRCSKVHKESRIAMYKGVNLGLTVDELEKYRSTHLNCEICNKTIEEAVITKNKWSPKRLALDHDHKTGKFRGVLCQLCNRQLGWYEKNNQAIISYLNKDVIS